MPSVEVKNLENQTVGEIALAQSLGVDCVVTDHHEQKDELPPAFALLYV